jgi:caa(3)-type oxidase subunit IV
MTTQAAISDHDADRSRPNYVAVLIYLAILTAIALGVHATGIPQVAKTGLLIALAWAEAVLIAMYFMHLAMEKEALAVFAMIPVVLVTFLCLMMLPDVTARTWTKSEHQIGAPNPAEAEENPVPPPAPVQPPQH